MRRSPRSRLCLPELVSTAAAEVDDSFKLSLMLPFCGRTTCEVDSLRRAWYILLDVPLAPPTATPRLAPF